jgi:hypothetical protein
MLMSLMKRLRVVALLNTSAGTIERQGDRALRDALATAFEKRGISAVLQFLPGTELRSAAERARQPVLSRADPKTFGHSFHGVRSTTRCAADAGGGYVTCEFGSCSIDLSSTTRRSNSSRSAHVSRACRLSQELRSTAAAALGDWRMELPNYPAIPF